MSLAEKTAPLSRQGSDYEQKDVGKDVEKGVIPENNSDQEAMACPTCRTKTFGLANSRLEN